MSKKTNFKVMYIFPGQGSQYKGIGSDIHKEFQIARDVYEKASNVLGYDLAELSFNDPENVLDKTKFTQPALLTHSIANLEVFNELTEHKIKPILSAGHSLGEYSALVAAGSLPFEDALLLVKRRGELMEKYGNGKMLAFRLDLDSLKLYVTKNYCEIAGCNLPVQTVIGGLDKDLESLNRDVEENLKSRGIWLNTEGAFHTYHMIGAAQEFRKDLEMVRFSKPEYAVVSNYTAEIHLTDPECIKAQLFYQVFNPVKWNKGMELVSEKGINTIIEFGGGIGKGSNPSEKRPNLASITKNILKRSRQRAIYLPAINVNSLQNTSYLFNYVEKAVDKPNDTMPDLQVSSGKGTAVDENWFHLYVPLEKEAVTENSIDTLTWIYKEEISEAVQLITQSKEENISDFRSLFDTDISTPEPYLEKVIGCSTGAILHYFGEEMREELLTLSKRLKNRNSKPQSQGILNNCKRNSPVDCIENKEYGESKTL